MAMNKLLLSVAALGLNLFPIRPLAATESMELENFEVGKLPVNKAGELYPDQYTGEGGIATVSLLTGDLVFGKRAGFTVTQGTLYAEFNAHNPDGTRGFAREYSANPSGWKFNTYNRLGFWIKNPVNGAPMSSDGTGSLEFGTYLKTVANPDMHSDETGGGHWYHILNLPNTGTWTYVIINSHPHHERGDDAQVDRGNQLHVTGETNYNYFDALTRFYINETHTGAKAGAPINYEIDEVKFYQETYPENDQQVYSITSTYVPAQNKFIMTWSRPKEENTIKQEVRYSDKNIHEIGWAAAKPAPNGILTPPGWQGYNGMLYTTTALIPTPGATIYVAIKPQNSDLFTQISMTLPGTVTTLPPAPQANAYHPASMREWAQAEPTAILAVSDLSGRLHYRGNVSDYRSGSASDAELIYRIRKRSAGSVWNDLVPATGR
jgi:hypothetical protein